MKIIISPAKKLCNDIKISNQTMNIRFLNESKELINLLKKKSVLEIKEMMKISDDLAALNWDRIQNWELTNVNTYKALELFNGTVYEGINLASFSKKDLNYSQNHLRIISGLYGMLKPQDFILPYRLEMGTRLENKCGANLYNFWGDKLLKELESDLNGCTLINLASNEYAKALMLKKLRNRILTPVFKDYKNGKLKVISFFAKKARGEMVNFIIKNQINTYDDLTLFQNDGYSFSHQIDEYMFFYR